MVWTWSVAEEGFVEDHGERLSNRLHVKRKSRFVSQGWSFTAKDCGEQNAGLLGADPRLQKDALNIN